MSPQFDNTQVQLELEGRIKELQLEYGLAVPRLGLYKELEKAVESNAAQQGLKTLNERVAKYRRDIADLPKNWRGKAKDTEALKRLERQIEDATRQIAGIPTIKKEDAGRMTELMQKLQLQGEVSPSKSSELYWIAQRQVWNLEKQIWMGGLQLVNVRDYGLGEAYAIFGYDLYGPAQLNHVFGTSLNKQDIPSLPERVIMGRAKELGAIMSLRVYRDGKPPEWRLFRKDILPETADKTYVEQSRAMRDYLKQHGFLKPDEEDGCTDTKLMELEKLAESDPMQATTLLTNLLVNQRHRHSFEDIAYFTWLTTWDDNNGKIHREGKSYSRLFDRNQEATKTQEFWSGGRPYSNIILGSHLGEGRGPYKDTMPINGKDGLGHGSAESRKQGVRLVFY